MEEEYEILESTVKDFNSKFVDNNSLKLENESMGPDFIRMLADQGFFSMMGQGSDASGSDLKALSIVLENLSKSAPAAAVKVLLVNAFSTLVNDTGILDSVGKGAKSGTVTFSDLLVPKGQNGSLKLENGRVKGEKEYVLGSDSDFILTLLDTGELILLKSGFSQGKKHKKLGFRSIGFSSINVDSSDYSVVAKDGIAALRKMYEDFTLPISAIAIGMSEGVSQKALDYAKVRTAFGHYLKDFQPLAFDLTSLIAEMNILKRYFHDLLSSPISRKEAMFLKHKSLILAKDMSKTSLQIHGGYGYLEDFGIEKFYRDSMALSVLFHREDSDMEELSSLVFEGKAGFV
ncbi:MAG: acyl-CoA/acyl-ACP dehydrogenase [Candidatus Thermoplasmatota archaeon]|nr:acyl-CoA/acyl-ACP dehydrogenase [Candidatus Thermoplasmatota archaeon]MCL5789087.1 acyl-CoA/acyl-ACP dehydrogenase [Candidatus Thermoplasmatota archaeon]